MDYLTQIAVNGFLPDENVKIVKYLHFHNMKVRAGEAISMLFEILQVDEVGPNQVEHRQLTIVPISNTDSIGSKNFGEQENTEGGLFTVPCNVAIKGDILIRVTNKAGKLLFRFAFHTGFAVDGYLRFKKRDLDCAVKKKRFPDEFILDMVMENAPEELQEQVRAAEKEANICSYGELYSYYQSMYLPEGGRVCFFSSEEEVLVEERRRKEGLQPTLEFADEEDEHPPPVDGAVNIPSADSSQQHLGLLLGSSAGSYNSQFSTRRWHLQPPSPNPSPRSSMSRFPFGANQQEVNRLMERNDTGYLDLILSMADPLRLTPPSRFLRG